MPLHLGRCVWCVMVSSGVTDWHMHYLLFITSFLLHWWTLCNSRLPPVVYLCSVSWMPSFYSALQSRFNQHLYAWWRHFCRIYWLVRCSLQSSHLLIHPWAAALWHCVIHPDYFPAPPGIKTITLWNRAAAVTRTSWFHAVCRSVVLVRLMSALFISVK